MQNSINCIDILYFPHSTCFHWVFLCFIWQSCWLIVFFPSQACFLLKFCFEIVKTVQGWMKGSKNMFCRIHVLGITKIKGAEEIIFQSILQVYNKPQKYNRLSILFTFRFEENKSIPCLKPNHQNKCINFKISWTSHFGGFSFAYKYWYLMPVVKT